MPLESNQPYQRVSQPRDTIWNGLAAGAIVGGGFSGPGNRAGGAILGGLTGLAGDAMIRASNRSKTQGFINGSIAGGVVGGASVAAISPGQRGKMGLLGGLTGGAIGGIAGAVAEANGPNY